MEARRHRSSRPLRPAWNSCACGRIRSTALGGGGRPTRARPALHSLRCSWRYHWDNFRNVTDLGGARLRGSARRAIVSMPSAMARCVFPVPVPSTKTMFSAFSVKSVEAKPEIRRRSIFDCSQALRRQRDQKAVPQSHPSGPLQEHQWRKAPHADVRERFSPRSRWHRRHTTASGSAGVSDLH